MKNLLSEKMIHKISIVLFILITTVVTILSLLPNPLPNLPNRIGLDKVLHFMAYLGLGFSLHLALHPVPKTRNPGRWKTILPVFIFALIYGGGIEFFQRFTGRSPEWMDLLADAAGGTAGASLSVLFLRKFSSREQTGIDPS